MGPKTLLEKEERIKAFYKDKEKLIGSWDSNCSRGNQNPRHELLRNEIDTGEQEGPMGEPVFSIRGERRLGESSRGELGTMFPALPWLSVLAQTESSSCLFPVSLEVAGSRPGSFRSRFAGWTWGVFPKAKGLRQTHRVPAQKPGTFWTRKSPIKHENSAAPRTREGADRGPFLICPKARPDGSWEKACSFRCWQGGAQGFPIIWSRCAWWCH